MDFEFERMSGDLVDAIEATVNAELAAARDVRVAVLPRDEAFAIPDLIRTKVNLLPEGIEEIRTIEIVGLDLQADGGTHVANTREVGGIRVTGYEIARAGSTSASGSRSRTPRRQSSGIARRSPTALRDAREGQRPGGHPPLEHVDMPDARPRPSGSRSFRSPSLVEIAREDREASKRDIRLLTERAVGDQHAVVAQLRSVGEMLRLQGVELVLRHRPERRPGGAGAPACRRRTRRGCSDRAASSNDSGKPKG